MHHSVECSTKIKRLDGLSALISLNEFPVRIQVCPHTVDHHWVIKVAVQDGQVDAVHDLLDGIFGQFVTANRFGMLLGTSNASRSASGANYAIEISTQNVLQITLDISGMDYRGIRVLVGMIRGEPSIDSQIGEIIVETNADMSLQETLRIVNERDIDLPNLRYETYSFDLQQDQEGRANIDRLVRVKLKDRPSKSAILSLMEIYDSWLRLCKGGFANSGYKAYERFVSGGKSYMISPVIFEMPIDTFDNDESCFDPLLCGLNYFAIRTQAISSVHIY